MSPYRPLGRLVPFYFSWNGTKYETSETPLDGKRYEGLFDDNDTGGALNSFIFLHAYVLASPRTMNYHHFVKEGCFDVCMNPWTKMECQQLADALQLDDGRQAKWIRRYDLVGGKPRILFSKSMLLGVLLKRVNASVLHAIEDLKQMVLLFEQQVFDERMRHMLFQFYRVDDDSSSYYLAFSSSALAIRLSQLMKFVHCCGTLKREKGWIKILATKNTIHVF